MPTAQLASDPSLNTTTGTLSDLIVLLRPVSQPSGGIIYQPQNITAADWFTAVLLPGMAALLDNLPTQDGTNSLFWNNEGVLTRTSGGGVVSGVPLTAEALQQSFKNFFPKAPTSDPQQAGAAFNPNDGLVHWSNGT